MISSVWCGGLGFLVKLGQVVSWHGYQRGFLTHPQQIHLPSCCSVLSKGILTPPLHSKGERPDLKIGSVVLPVLPLHANRLLYSWCKRPPVLHPFLFPCQSINLPDFPHCSPDSQAFRANTKVTFTQSSSAKWEHWTTLLPCPPPSLHCAFTQTHPLPPMSYICVHFWE